MKANELRIGNIVSIFGIEQHIITELKDTIYVDLNPIPLTEEWLLKFGFEEQIGYSKLVNDRYSFEIAWNDVGKWYAFFRNFNKGKQDDFVTLKNNLKYVHQLQNLYFALTGEELKLLKYE